MSLTFYYSPMSTATLTDLVIEELGIPCKRIKLDLRAGDTRKPDYLKINPNGKVPTIVHDDMPIFESAAITMYLGEVFGVDKKLYPAPGPKRGEAMKWVTWANVTLGETVGRWARNTTDWTPVEQRNEKAGAAAKKEMEGNLKILDDALTGKSFLLGNDYSLVDTHMNSLIDWLKHMKVDFAPYANVRAWAERCGARPAYKKVVGGMQ